MGLKIPLTHPSPICYGVSKTVSWLGYLGEEEEKKVDKTLTKSVRASPHFSFTLGAYHSEAERIVLLITAANNPNAS